ncbi:lipid A export permease/ATP-binding protein MsbA [Celerinatantimonas diazotrophica]|uniref:Subfamily B ATP-binding cassette protein MsbA n=1 Tax=Celerinatantimonas diazotrophica TaxID=412034 RepID=A0A4R1J811_9GAMM|nr:lipid A export permease/ATP-binding protein MsbA [Celerinatantimonas diazotrophica]TCK46576.1 subfamily B ATP-binding cassette protein MsbA [Celerinatantimonas diazotrophica]CAG9296626.1 Lipid A export ATP-binding/permease protein MsbA [Celerinatantimonas diazotrophica]
MAQEKSTSLKKSNFTRLLAYVSERKAGLFAAIIGMIGYACVDVTFIYSIKPLIDQGLSGKDPSILKIMPFFVVGIVLLRGVCNFISSYCMSWVGSHVVMKMQQQIFAHLMSMPISYFDRHSIGTLLSKITYDTNQIADASTKTLVTMVKQGGLVIGLLGMMFYNSWQLSLIFLIIGPIVAIAIRIVSRRFRRISKNLQDAVGNVTAVSEQMLNGHREVLAFNGQDKETERFKKVSNAIRRQQMKMSATSAIANPVVQAVAVSGLGVVLYIASFPEIMNQLSAGTFTVIVTSMMMLLQPIKQLTQLNTNFQRGMAACTSIFTVLDEQIETDSGTYAPDRVKGEIVFDQVTFSYPTKSEAVLRNISFDVPAGKTVALVGRSGSGKTTIASLLPRFYEITQGSIRIDGYSVDEFKLPSLRRQFSMVSQNVHLFAGSIAENIAYAQEQATREQITQAAEMANVMEFAERLPDGLDTIIGERGLMLSGGQRQRVAIARALLRDAPILVLDEATSALDTASERKIQEAIERVCQDRTAIVIAHRLSTIENADEIMVIDDGHLIERGDHKQLMAKKGSYYRLYQMQFGGESA